MQKGFFPAVCITKTTLGSLTEYLNIRAVLIFIGRCAELKNGVGNVEYHRFISISHG